MTLIVLGAVTLYCLTRLYEVYHDLRKTGIKSHLFRLVIKLPIARSYAALENEKVRKEYVEKYTKARPNPTKVLPKKGADKDKIIQKLKGSEKYSRGFFVEGGRVSGAVYIADDEHWDFIGEVQRMFAVSNPLHIEEFMPVCQMEAEIIRMVLNLYHGDSNSCGLVTSGGTESILLACLAYRE